LSPDREYLEMMGQGIGGCLYGQRFNHGAF